MQNRTLFRFKMRRLNCRCGSPLSVSVWTSSSSGLSVLKNSQRSNGASAWATVELQCGWPTCGGAPGEARRPAAVAAAGDHARALGGEARLALDGDGVPGFVERPRGPVPNGPQHVWRGTRHICATDKRHFYTFNHRGEAPKKLVPTLETSVCLELASGPHLHRWEECSMSRPACTRPRLAPSGSLLDTGNGPRSGRCTTPPGSLSARRSPLSEALRSRSLKTSVFPVTEVKPNTPPPTAGGSSLPSQTGTRPSQPWLMQFLVARPTRRYLRWWSGVRHEQQRRSDVEAAQLPHPSSQTAVAVSPNWTPV